MCGTFATLVPSCVCRLLNVVVTCHTALTTVHSLISVLHTIVSHVEYSFCDLLGVQNDGLK